MSQKKVDVFLSSRDDDTTKKFTDHLHANLQKNGIETFRDGSKLEAGEEIAPELFKAIQESWCSVIVISETYVSSGWCLDKLVEIVKRSRGGHKIFPIFYDVDPSYYRKGEVGEAFVKPENKDKTKRWQDALIEVACLKGWCLNNRIIFSWQAKVIRNIVESIANLGSKDQLFVPGLIGINSRFKELRSKIIFGENVRIIGICGIDGIGKTTLAEVIFNQMSRLFDGKSFLADVREVSEKCGLVSLQKQLLSQVLPEQYFSFVNVHEGNAMISHRLSHKKVLVVIDDADNIQHLECLVGRRDWFGPESRIIITTRDERLLESYGVDYVYKPATLDDNEAFDLFSLKAFKSDTVPENDIIKFSERVVAYADGLPLALEVLGSFLCGSHAIRWRTAIERLQRHPQKDILDKLQISFDGLGVWERHIFLDIACFFNGENKNLVEEVLCCCESNPYYIIAVLIEKSLIKVDKENKLWMHQLLQEMGRKIVRQNFRNEPRKYIGSSDMLLNLLDMKREAMKGNEVRTEALVIKVQRFNGQHREAQIQHP